MLSNAARFASARWVASQVIAPFVRVVDRDRWLEPDGSRELVGIEAVLLVEDSPDGGVELGFRHVAACCRGSTRLL